ncbi:MAG: allantoicase [Streptosporangiales bacterium]|nr:allantoicase [Streptosporangiales bacterium]
MTETPEPGLPDLAVATLGGRVVAASDEFFAEAANLLAPHEPEFRPGTFGPRGQVYDGWETRRRRNGGHDQVVVALGVPGVIRSVVVDTAHFTGNFPESCAVQACGVEGYPSAAELEQADWVEIVPVTRLKGDTRHTFRVTDGHRFTHVRLHIDPDGGVARLRVHGDPVPDPRPLAGITPDLAALENGGAIHGCSDMFYGSPVNLLMPGQAATMGEGWETRRRRGAGNDWVTVELAAPGVVRMAELDTSHFLGNAPGEVRLSAIDARTADPGDPRCWTPLLSRTPLRPDTRHRFPLPWGTAATHVRMDIYPDGGMARLRLYGLIASDGLSTLAARWFDLLPASQAAAVLEGAGAQRGEVEAYVGARPLGTPPPALARELGLDP